MDVKKLIWRGIEIEVRSSVPFSAHREVYGQDMYHVEVRSVKPDLAALPITETGYRSIWLVEERLEEYGGAVAYVTAFLEHEAKSKKWEAKEEVHRQYQLF